MTHRMFGTILMGALLLAGSPARAGEIKEPASGVGFPLERTWGKYRMKCIGTGLRRKFGFKVYAGCFYVDKALGKEKLQAFLASGKAGSAYAGGKLDAEGLLRQKSFYDWLIAADLPISVDMTFVRDVPADKIKETYKEGLSLYLKDQAVIEKFIALPDREVKEFQHLTLNLMPGGRVVLQFAGKTHPTIVSKPLARALLSIYFGSKPVSDDIKRGLVRHVAWLLE